MEWKIKRDQGLIKFMYVKNAAHNPGGIFIKIQLA